MSRPGTNRSSVPGRSHHLLGSAEAIAVSHPAAPIPDPLFADPAAESRWQARFSAVRISLPVPARNSQDRAVFVSNESGRYQLYCWDVAGGRRLRCTDRAEGTTVGVLSTNGQGLWWFDDSDGDEFGRWMAQPFGAAPGSAGIALLDVPPGYSAGLEVGLGVVLAGFSDDEGTRVHLNRGGRGTQVVYRHATDAGVGALATDEKLWVLEHTEHGDSRYPALRAIMVDDGSIVAELDDSPGKGLCCLGFSPISGDQRLLVGHERRGRDELLIWDAASGETQDLDIALDGDLTGCFFRDGKAVLVLRTHHGHRSGDRPHHQDLRGLPDDDVHHRRQVQRRVGPAPDRTAEVPGHRCGAVRGHRAETGQPRVRLIFGCGCGCGSSGCSRNFPPGRGHSDSHIGPAHSDPHIQISQSPANSMRLPSGS